MMKSILQKKDGRCYLCMMLHGDDGIKTVQEHHIIYGTANRKLSERYGLKVYLCLYHHEEGPEAVHRNAELSGMLKALAQRAFRKRFPDKDWMSIFGRNYDMSGNGNGQEMSGRQQDPQLGFILLETEQG